MTGEGWVGYRLCLRSEAFGSFVLGSTGLFDCGVSWRDGGKMLLWERVSFLMITGGVRIALIKAICFCFNGSIEGE